MSNAELVDCNPPYLFPDYKITVRRAPAKRLVQLPPEWFHHMPGPVFGRIPVQPGDNDLTNQHEGRPIGQRVVLSGRVLDSDGRPVPDTLIEVWQANAAGLYIDPSDPGLMAFDPNFSGAGRTLTDSMGRYEFRTVRPAAYPGTLGALFRPAHIHVSLFGPGLSTRMITQCYFEDDPLLRRDPIVQAVGRRGIDRLLARFNDDRTELGGKDSALAYDWDIVLRGPRSTPMEND